MDSLKPEEQAPPPTYPTIADIRAKQRAWEDIATPELGPGCVIRVCTMSARMRASFENVSEDTAAEDLPGVLISRCAVDPQTGARWFTDDDAAWINDADWAWVARVTEAAARLNGIGTKATRALVKN